MNIINIINDFNDLNTNQNKDNIKNINLPNSIIYNDSEDNNINNTIDYIENIDDIIECIICKENIDNYQIEKLKCGCRNLAHKECLIEWLKIKNVCPICRKNIINNTITRTFNIYNNDNTSDTISISINNINNNGLNSNISNNINIDNININNDRSHFPKWCSKFWIFFITILLTFLIIFPAIHKNVN